MVADNLERTIAAAAERTETVEDDALIEGVRATKRLLEQTLSHFGASGQTRLRTIDATTPVQTTARTEIRHAPVSTSSPNGV